MMIRRLTAAVVLSGLALVTMVTAAVPAFAHAELVGSNPAKDASLASPPQQLQLTFNETVSPQSITVAGPAGSQWTVGEIKVEGPVVTAPVVPAGPEGQYTITYRVLSDDGDSVTGTVAFTMTAPATRTAPSSSAPAASGSGGDSTGLPAWVWVLAIAVLLGAGAVIGRRVRRPS
jgi:copper resistance protein C